MTRRYAEFAASILTLNEEYSDPNLNNRYTLCLCCAASHGQVSSDRKETHFPSSNSLQRLRNEVEGLLARMSNELQEQKNRVVFLINNYDLIATVLKVRILCYIIY